MSPTRHLVRRMIPSILVVTASTQVVFLIGAAFPAMGPAFGFGPTGLGAITAIFFMTASVASVTLGRQVERIGWRTAMRINTLVAAAVALGIALVAHDTAVLIMLLVVGGTAYGLANPAANQALAERAPSRHRALVFGFKHAGIPASTLIAGLLVPLIVVTVGWRAAYLVAAGFAIAVFFTIPGDDRTAATPDDGVAAKPVGGGLPLSDARLAVLAGGSSLATWAAIALSTYLVAAAIHDGFSESAAGYLLFAGSLSSIAGRIAAGAVADRRQSRGFAAVAALLVAGSFVFVGLIAASGAVFAVLVLMAFATGWGWPGLMTYTVVNANLGSAGASSAVTQGGVFLGAALGPLVLGWLVDRHGFDVAWMAVVAALMVAALVVAAVGKASAPRPTG